jgi:hypothetical protein
MSIPAPHDGKLAEIENAANGIVTQLRTMHHAAARDVPAMRAQLRETVQGFVNQVMALARDGGK